MGKLAPSLYAADYLNLGAQLKAMECAGAEYIHIDVMDGVFVPNISFGVKFVENLRCNTTKKLDVHMMVKDPLRFVVPMAKAGADVMVVHYEACEDILGTIRAIKENGMEAGVALKMETPLSVLSREIIESADVIHLMSVEPGVESCSFHDEIYDRIASVKELLSRAGKKCSIEVDGGINAENIQRIVRAGADILVSGKALFIGDISQSVREFEALIGTA